MLLRALAAGVALVTVLAPSGAQAAVPSDPLASTWTYEAIGLLAAWDVTTGSEAVVIAVVDTGVQASHPDLLGAFHPGLDLIGHDYDDVEGHGTAVAGLAAARANNGLGAAGACWSCRIMSLRVVENGFVVEPSFLQIAVDYAVATGAAIVNLSLSGGLRDPNVEQAILRARAEGVLVVAAAGNEGRTSAATTERYPAAYPGVLSVAATVESGGLADYSSRGDWVKLAAPASSPTTLLGGGFGVVGPGTSFAAPLVSGVVGLLRSRFPLHNASQLETALTETARPTAGIRFGRVDAFAALQRLAEMAPALEPTILGAAIPGQRLTAYSGVWPGAGLAVAYRWERCRGESCAAVGDDRTYAVRREDGGARLRAVLSAPGFETAVSGLTALVPTRVRNEAAPSISGRPLVGSRLTARRGSWTGTSLRFTYQWVRCPDAACRSGRFVAHGVSYLLREADRGRRLKLAVTATGALGRATAHSRPTPRIR
jgi:hypothetical protein